MIVSEGQGPEAKPTPEAIELTVDEIRERAYDVWERNHRPEGFEVAFWVMAERELKAERQALQIDSRATDFAVTGLRNAGMGSATRTEATLAADQRITASGQP